MTFGSVFGRVFSPTFQPKSQAAGGGWWDLNGTITSCVAAYQPKGAASYAASKVNLANPGTYNAVDGTAPDWDAVNGWKFDGVDDWLDTDAVVTDRYGALIVRFSGATTQNNDAGITCYFSSTRRGNFGIMPNTQYGVRYYQLSSPCNKSPSAASGVLAISDFHGYRDGVEDGSWSPNFATGETNVPLNIGRTNSFRGTVYCLVNVQAWVLYSSPITPAQVSALTTAMNAL